MTEKTTTVIATATPNNNNDIYISNYINSTTDWKLPNKHKI